MQYTWGFRVWVHQVVQNHYRCLGLPDGASIERVRVAYAGALQVFLQSQKSGKPLPKADFEALRAAYAVLGDPEQKAAYDRRLAGAAGPLSNPTVLAVPALPRAGPEGQRVSLQKEIPHVGSKRDAEICPQTAPPAGRSRRTALEPSGKPPLLREDPNPPPASPRTASRSDILDVSLELRRPPAPEPRHSGALSGVQGNPGRSEALSPAKATVVRHPLSFTGNGSEYFRIWIVNLLLNLVTLGLYSPWAKVRREKYFHRNTLLDGCGFDFHGRPLAILKGRILAYIMLVSLTLVQSLEPNYYFIAVILVLPIVPWLLLRSFIFRARNTSHRGLRLEFGGTYLESFVTYIGFGLLSIVTALIAFPLLCMRIKRFRFDNLSFGGFNFETDLSGKTIFWIFLSALLIFMGSLFALFLFLTLFNVSSITLVVLVVGFAVISAVSAAYVQANLANHVWNSIRLGRHSFESTQTFGELSWIVIGNTVLTMLTLGLYWPWAKVRLARYLAEHLVFHAADVESLNEFVGTRVADATASGEEITEAFDFDIAL
jgi:uncharacterized membrane protein YjgN (DUF898 family)